MYNDDQAPVDSHADDDVHRAGHEGVDHRYLHMSLTPIIMHNIVS